MDLYSILSAKLDTRKGSYDSSFNGYLEDYVELIEDQKSKEFFECVLKSNQDLKIITDVRFKVSEESVSNAIIRYKDIYKLNSKAIIVPAFIYNKDKVLLIGDNYIYAKAMYYALTEKGSELQDNKNDLVALSYEDDVCGTLEKFDLKKTGQLQRNIDRKHFACYENGFNEALKLSKEITDTYIENARNTKQKEKYISSCVSKWYLLKKFVYVSYMVDKDILKKDFNNDVKKQRAQAKKNADSIEYVPMSKMWEEIRKKKG